MGCQHSILSCLRDLANYREEPRLEAVGEHRQSTAPKPGTQPCKPLPEAPRDHCQSATPSAKSAPARPAVPSLKGTSWRPILVRAWETPLPEHVRSVMEFSFDHEEKCVMPLPQFLLHQCLTKTSEGVAEGRAFITFDYQISCNGSLDTGTCKAYVQEPGWMVMTFEMRSGWNGFGILAREGLDAVEPLPSLCGTWRAAFLDVWPTRIPAELRQRFTVSFDDMGNGEGGCGGMRYVFFSEDNVHLEIKKVRQIVELGDGHELSSGDGHVFLQAAAPGLLCIKTLSSPSDSYLFSLAAHGFEGLPAFLPRPCWNSLMLQIDTADVKELGLKSDNKSFTVTKATMSQPQRLVLNSLLVGSLAESEGWWWWQAAVGQAEERLAAGNPSDRVWALLTLAAVAVRVDKALATSAVDAIAATIDDASSPVRRAAVELLMQLAGLTITDPLVCAAAAIAGVDLREAFTSTDIPLPVTCTKEAVNTEALPLPAIQQAACSALRQAADQTAGSASACLRILILCKGSRGDLEPMVLLAQELQARGCLVRALVRANNVSFCEGRGLRALPAWPDLEFVWRATGGVSEDANFLADFLAAEHKFCKLFPNALINPMEEAVCFAPDATLWDIGGGGEVALKYERDRGVPAVPIIGTGLLGALAVPTIRPWRPSFVTTSRLVDSMGTGSHNYLHQTGAFLCKEPPSRQQLADGPLAQLSVFLEEGPPPVAVGWGSMMMKGLPPVAMLIRALMAVKAANRRAVVIGGWAKLDNLGRTLAAGGGQTLLSDCSETADVVEELRDDERRSSLEAFARTRCCFVAAAPHQWLFPRCYCIVHHGGAGTTHAVLRAGKPCIITPIAFDQFHWGSQVERLGVGISFRSGFQSVTAESLAVAIDEAEGLIDESEELGARMRSEGEGQAPAAEILLKFLASKTRQGAWQRRRLAFKD